MKTAVKILQTLKDNPGSFISGEQMAGRLNISRTAVWKSIQRLEGKGYKIKARKKEGYQLNNVPDFLLPAEIQDGLKTKFIGKDIRYYKEVDSTNEQAKKLAAKGIKEGTVLVAEKQTKGKGRLGRPWVSPPGGIWMSVILKPKFAPAEAPLVNMVATVAIAAAIKEVTGIGARIKWPNDVMIEINKNGALRKVSGILTEMAAEVDRINYLIVGLGINVNNSLPGELKGLAVSLNDLQDNISRTLLARKVLEKFEYYYLLWREQGAGAIVRECRKLSAVLGRTVKVSMAQGVITGQAVDINDKGSLIIKLKDKTRKEILAGEVSLSL